MIPAIVVLAVLLTAPVCYAQNVVASKDFGNNRSLLIHELPLTKSINDTDFLMLKEGKRGEFDLIRYDLELNEVWKLSVRYDAQLNVPQLLINEKQAMLASYTIRDSDRTAYLSLKTINLENGELISDQAKSLVIFSSQGHYPRLSFSPDLSKILIANYLPEESSVGEIRLFDSSDLSLIKACSVDAAIYGLDKLNEYVVDDQGNVFFASIHVMLFRMDGYFIAAEEEEAQVLQHDIFFMRPMESVGSLLIEAANDSAYYMVAASGKIGEELIGLKLAGFDFENFAIPLDTVCNFTMQYVYNLYQDAIPVSRFVKKSTLKAPYSLANYELQEMRINSQNDIILLYENNLSGTHYHKRFNNGRLLFTYNTKGKIQKSEDIIVQSFSQQGDLLWDRAIQKYQVTRPHKYFLSYVSNLHDDKLNILSWTKKRNHSFQVCSLDALTGEPLKSGLDVINDAKYTYHKNYTTWIGSGHIAITTQKGNRMGAREIQVVSVE